MQQRIGRKKGRSHQDEKELIFPVSLYSLEQPQQFILPGFFPSLGFTFTHEFSIFLADEKRMYKGNTLFLFEHEKSVIHDCFS